MSNATHVLFGVLSLALLAGCVTSSSSGGSVFASVGVIETIEATPIRYVGGTIDVDVSLYENLNIGTVSMWLTDPALTVTPLVPAQSGHQYSVSYVAPANTSLTGVNDNYSVRVEVRNPDGAVLIDHDHAIVVPAMQLPPNPPTF